MLTRLEDTRHTALQANLHQPTQDETPLRRTRAMKLAAKPYRAGAQLITARGKHFGQHGLWRSLIQRHGLFTKPGTPIGISEQDGFGKRSHTAKLTLQPTAHTNSAVGLSVLRR